jgi:integrase
VRVAVLKGLHHVKRKLADGSYSHHYYAWRGGPRMLAKPGTDAFNAEFFRLRDERDQAAPATIETLIGHFTGPERQRNPDFLALAETTQVDHLYAFKLIKAEWPRLPVRLTQKKGMKAEIRKWHRSFAATPRKADKLLFSLSKVFSYAIADELIAKNPCAGIKRLYEGSRRDSVWTPELIASFRAGAPKHLLLPFEIAIATGQRQGDILALSWKDYDGTYLRFTQSKTDVRLKVKVHSALKATLDAMPKDKLRICLNSRGRPWTKDGFKTSWGKVCDRLLKAGIEGLDKVTFHDLRGTFISDRAREGSSVDDIARISGHSSSEIKSTLEKHYLAHDQDASDAVILRMENGLRRL